MTERQTDAFVPATRATADEWRRAWPGCCEPGCDRPTIDNPYLCDVHAAASAARAAGMQGEIDRLHAARIAAEERFAASEAERAASEATRQAELVARFAR